MATGSFAFLSLSANSQITQSQADEVSEDDAGVSQESSHDSLVAHTPTPAPILQKKKTHTLIDLALNSNSDKENIIIEKRKKEKVGLFYHIRIAPTDKIY